MEEKRLLQAFNNATQESRNIAIDFLKLAQELDARQALETMLSAGRIDKALFDELTKGA